MGEAVRRLRIATGEDLRWFAEQLVRHEHILPHGWTVESVLKGIAARTCTPVIADCNSGKAAILFIRAGHVLQIVFAAGEGMVECMEDLAREFVAHVGDDITAIQVFGRRGWDRLARRFGLEESGRIWFGDISGLRRH